MSPRTRGLAMFASLVLLGSHASGANAAWPRDTHVGLAISALVGDQRRPNAVPDGAGGVFLVWEDARAGNVDIYAQHLGPQSEALWSPNGVPVCAAPGDQQHPMLDADGAGGIVVAWEDARVAETHVFAQRLDAAGAPVWTPDGVRVCTVDALEEFPLIARDGQNGALVAWADHRGGGAEVYLQQVKFSGLLILGGPGLALGTGPGLNLPTSMVGDGANGAFLAWTKNATLGLGDPYVQHMRGGGGIAWPAGGVALCTAPTDQYAGLVADGTGGVIAAFVDGRSGTSIDVYAQRVNAAGVVQWGANGLPICVAPGDIQRMSPVTDGAGGMIVAWQDHRSGTRDAMFAQRVDSVGSVRWALDGVPLCAASGDQQAPWGASDGHGGMIVAWQDHRSAAGFDVYAQRVDSSGVLQWSALGAPVSLASGSQQAPTTVADGAGGVVVAWEDARGGSGLDVYAQRIERGYGAPGSPEALITSARDVPGDQGGEVRVLWSSSCADVPAYHGIESYTLWRRVSAAAAARALAAGVAPAGGAAAGPGRLRITRDGAQTLYWEFIANVPARTADGYGYTASTAADSTASGVPWNVFFVDAKLAALPESYFSPADSAYSVDNLAPPTPAPFSGTYASGTAELQWGASFAPDFTSYRIYRGTTPGFALGPGSLVATPTGTTYADAAGAPYYYKLTAADLHGNESAAALLLPAGALAVDGAAPLVLALALPQPNPAHGATRIVYTLAAAGEARLEVFDAAGRRVRELFAGRGDAGEHALRFDLRDDSGRALPAGAYRVRLRAGGREVTRALVATR